MAKSYAKKSWARRKAEAQVKKSWAVHKKNAKARRNLRKKVREQERSRASTGLEPVPFFERHWRLADLKDSVSLRGHVWLDKRELRSGILTSDELDSFMDHQGGIAEWRALALEKRKANYRAQQLANRDGDRSPLAIVYGGQPGQLPRIKHVGFRPPAPRQGTAVLTPVSAVSPRPPVRRRRKNHVERVATAWEPQLRENARLAMAADADLSGAARSVQSFAEQFPATRSELHNHLGKMAEFGKLYSEAMDAFQATLRKGSGAENPGLPPEVLQHLSPLSEVGDTIRRSCNSTVAAWEDYFADAIRIASDEHTPSKAALTS